MKVNKRQKKRTKVPVQRTAKYTRNLANTGISARGIDIDDEEVIKIVSEPDDTKERNDETCMADFEAHKERSVSSQVLKAAQAAEKSEVKEVMVGSELMPETEKQVPTGETEKASAWKNGVNSGERKEDENNDAMVINHLASLVEATWGCSEYRYSDCITTSSWDSSVPLGARKRSAEGVFNEPKTSTDNEGTCGKSSNSFGENVVLACVDGFGGRKENDCVEEAELFPEPREENGTKGVNVVEDEAGFRKALAEVEEENGIPAGPREAELDPRNWCSPDSRDLSPAWEEQALGRDEYDESRRSVIISRYPEEPSEDEKINISNRLYGEMEWENLPPETEEEGNCGGGLASGRCTIYPSGKKAKKEYAILSPGLSRDGGNTISVGGGCITDFNRRGRENGKAVAGEKMLRGTMNWRGPRVRAGISASTARTLSRFYRKKSKIVSNRKIKLIVNKRLRNIQRNIRGELRHGYVGKHPKWHQSSRRREQKRKDRAQQKSEDPKNQKEDARKGTTEEVHSNAPTEYEGLPDSWIGNETTSRRDRQNLPGYVETFPPTGMSGIECRMLHGHPSTDDPDPEKRQEKKKRHLLSRSCQQQRRDGLDQPNWRSREGSEGVERKRRRDQPQLRRRRHGPRGYGSPLFPPWSTLR